MDDPVLMLGAVAVAIVFGLGAMREIRRSRVDADAWAQTIRLLGGDARTRRPKQVETHIDGYPVWIHAWGAKKAVSAGITAYHEYMVWLDVPSVHLQVAPPKGLDESLPFLIHDKVTTGDPAFDGTFRVRANDVGVALAFLTPDRRAALLRLHHEFPKAFFEFERIALRVKGSRDEPQRMAATARRLAEFAADIAPPGIK